MKCPYGGCKPHCEKIVSMPPSYYYPPLDINMSLTPTTVGLVFTLFSFSVGSCTCLPKEPKNIIRMSANSLSIETV